MATAGRWEKSTSRKGERMSPKRHVPRTSLQVVLNEDFLMMLGRINDVGVVVHDRGKVIMVNDRYLQMFQLTPAEVLGRNMMKSTLTAKYVAIAQRMIAEDCTEPYEAVGLRKDNTTLPIVIHTWALKYAERNLRVAFIRELPLHKEQTKVSEDIRFRTIMNNIEDGYYETDLLGNFTLFNQAFCSIIGIERSELLGVNYRQCTCKEDICKVFHAFNTMFTTGTSIKGFEWNILHKDGTVKTVDLTANVIRSDDGSPIGFCG
ncbi:MAG: PAS domain-containing protein, partial [Syntrophales bacterium]|nr:PAS domain-containing protein [Syntrophales bacterium]